MVTDLQEAGDTLENKIQELGLINKKQKEHLT